MWRFLARVLKRKNTEAIASGYGQLVLSQIQYEVKDQVGGGAYGGKGEDVRRIGG